MGSFFGAMGIVMIICGILWVIALVITIAMLSKAKKEPEAPLNSGEYIRARIQSRNFLLLGVLSLLICGNFLYGLTIIFGIFLAVTGLFLTILSISNLSDKECSLVLGESGIVGNRKTVFSSKSLSLPINKIDSIFVKDSLIDKISGGKTVVIRSASGKICFPWVQNAQEFVDRTLAEINQSNSSTTVRYEAPTAPASDSFEKIQKLKNLLDQGLLSQEEYDAKRKELLEKI